MNIVYLMGGDTQSNKENYPLYLSEISERIILEMQLDYTKDLNASKVIFCVKERDLKKFKIKEIVQRLVSNAEIITINAQTKGAVCTALLAMEHINNDEELLILGVDDFIDGDVSAIVNSFREEQKDGGVMCFTSVHPRYSYVKLNAKDAPSEFAVKKPISKNALASFHYFKRGSDFVKASMNVIRNDSLINDAFFISQVFNEMILAQKSIGVYRIPNERFHPLKSAAQLAQYLAEVRDIRESK